MPTRDSHPATSNKEYTDEEFEFLQALDKHAASQGRRASSFVEVFRLITDELGYSRPPRPIDYSHRTNVVFPKQKCRVVDPHVLEDEDSDGT